MKIENIYKDIKSNRRKSIVNGANGYRAGIIGKNGKMRKLNHISARLDCFDTIELAEERAEMLRILNPGKIVIIEKL